MLEAQGSLDKRSRRSISEASPPQHGGVTSVDERGGSHRDLKTVALKATTIGDERSDGLPDPFAVRHPKGRKRLRGSDENKPLPCHLQGLLWEHKRPDVCVLGSTKRVFSWRRVSKSSIDALEGFRRPSPDELVLRGEVAEQCAPVHTHLAGDVVHRDVVKALVDEHPHGRSCDFSRVDLRRSADSLGFHNHLCVTQWYNLISPAWAHVHRGAHMTETTARFAGRTIIVTGAGSGIGRSTSLRLAKEGARVIGTDVVEQRLTDLVAELDGFDVSVVVGDVTKAETIDAIIQAAGGKVDGLANVAGIMDGFLPPDEVDDATWERVMSVNVTGPMRLTRAVLPLMIEAGKGAIVNVASEAALRASASGAAYTASKHAIAGYTKSVAFFHGPQGIKANAVAPGSVKTSIEAPMKSDYAASRVGPVLSNVVPAPAEPEKLAAAITWLLSDDSDNINGVVLPSDSGWSAI